MEKKQKEFHDNKKKEKAALEAQLYRFDSDADDEEENDDVKSEEDNDDVKSEEDNDDVKSEHSGYSIDPSADADSNFSKNEL